MAGNKTNIFIDGAQANSTLKELRAAVGKLNQEIKELPRNSDEYKKKVTELQQANTALKQHYNNVRAVSDSFKEAQTSVKGMLSQFAPVALGIGAITTAASGLVGAIGGGIRGIFDFDTALADLKAVTGANSATMDIFKEKAIEFSSRFGESAADIATAFKLAGSARPELLQNAEAMSKLTEQAIILAKASGDDVPTSIANLTGTLNAFDAPAERAGEVMDILANAAQLGVQEIPYLTEAFGKFGGVANQAGVSIGESAAALEILGKKIKEPSTAGTNMRGILTKLQIEAQKSGREFKSLGEELDIYGSSVKDVELLKKKFGEENLLAIQTLINEREELGKLTVQYGETGTAAEQAAINSGTISEAWSRLVQTFNAQFLGLNDSSGALVDALDWISENFDSIVTVVGKAIKVFAIYKGVMAVMSIQQRLFGDETGKVTRSFDQLKKNMDGSSGSAKGFGSALKGIGWTAVIAVVSELAVAWYDVASGAKAARESQELYDKYTADASKKSAERVSQRQKELQDEVSELQRKRNENKITEKEFLAQKERAVKATEDAIKADIKAVETRLKNNQKESDQYTDMLKRYKESGKFGLTDKESELFYKKFASDIPTAEKGIAELNAKIGAGKEKIKVYSDELHGVSEAVKDATSEIKVNSIAHEDNSKKLTASKKIYENLRNELDKLIQKVKEFESDNSYEDRLATYEDGLNKELFILQENIQKKYADEIELARKLMNEKGEIGIKATEQYNKLLIIQDEDYERQALALKEKYAKEAKDKQYELEKESALRSIAQEESYQAALIEIKVARAQAALNAVAATDKAGRAKAEEELRKALLEQLEWEKKQKLNALLDQYDDGTIGHQELVDRKKEIERQYLDDVEKMNSESAEKISKLNQEKFTNALNLISQAVDVVSTQFDIEYKDRVKQAENATAREKKLLQDKYDSGIISKEQYETQLAAIDLEAEEKKNQLQNEYARKKKAAAKIQALINGALAITQAFAQLGPVAGAIAAALIVASTAQQVSIIDQQEVDQFADGGYTNVVGKQDGLRYRAKNLGRHKGGMLPNSPSLVLASERGPEYFVPYHLMQNQVVANHVAAIDAIRTNQFFDGGYTMPPGSDNSADILLALKQNTAVMQRLNQQIPRMKAVVDDKNAEGIVNKAIDVGRFRG